MICLGLSIGANDTQPYGLQHIDHYEKYSAKCGVVG